MQYGLQSAFSEIERLSHEVTSSGNPISMNMKTRYKVKGVGVEQTISSVVNIFHEGGKITKVQDKWDGKLPDGAIANVSVAQLLSPFWWMYYTWAWIFHLWSFIWWTRPWLVRTTSFCPASWFALFLCIALADYSRCRPSATSTRSQYRRSSQCPRIRRKMPQEATRSLDALWPDTTCMTREESILLLIFFFDVTGGSDFQNLIFETLDVDDLDTSIFKLTSALVLAYEFLRLFDTYVDLLDALVTGT